MRLKTYKKEELSVQKFLLDVYSWLCEPRNRTVEELHYSFAECTECKDLEELRKDKGMRELIKTFLEQRMMQGEGIDVSTVPVCFFAKATTEYICNMYS